MPIRGSNFVSIRVHSCPFVSIRGSKILPASSAPEIVLFSDPRFLYN
jgi:hypothetical protein